MFFIVFDHVNACASMRLLVKIHNIEVKLVWQISYPPANGASLGSYLAVFRAKMGKLNYSLFYFASPEIVSNKVSKVLFS